LWGPEKGDGAFWNDLDWDVAIQQGMDYWERDYSGQYEFVETEAFWPLNHQVSPKEEVLSCTDCHSRNNSRIASLNDFYLPGRDYDKAVDYSGFALIFLSLFGISVHTILRIVAPFKFK
jgi:hypothetical protein